MARSVIHIVSLTLVLLMVSNFTSVSQDTATTLETFRAPLLDFIQYDSSFIDSGNIAQLHELYRIKDFQLYWKSKYEQDKMHQYLNLGKEMDSTIATYCLSLFTNNRLYRDCQAVFKDIYITEKALLKASEIKHGEVPFVEPFYKKHSRTTDSVFFHLLSTQMIRFHPDSFSLAFESKIEESKLLQQTIAHYEVVEQTISVPEIQYTDTLRRGDIDSLVLSIRQWLFVHRDLSYPYKLHSMSFDARLEEALMQFQRRVGLPETGYLDIATTEKLNQPISDLVDLLRANLERWKWLPEKLDNYHVFVNIPEYKLKLVKDGNAMSIHKIIVGKKDRETPVFFDEMTYLDVNPTWTIPPTILKEDVVPSALNDSDYLSRKNINVISRDSGKHVLPEHIDWSLDVDKRYRFIQAPGNGNALGIIKFMFPNPYYIYFHDTPSKSHFNLESRAYSSGCIRVQDPILLAEKILNDSVKYSLALLDTIVKHEKTKRISLNDRPKVYINYFTVRVDTSGLLYFYEDIYAKDDSLIYWLTESKNELMSSPAVIK